MAKIGEAPNLRISGSPKPVIQTAVILVIAVTIVGVSEVGAYCPANGCGPGQSVLCISAPDPFSCGWSDSCVGELCVDITTDPPTATWGSYCILAIFACDEFGLFTCCW